MAETLLAIMVTVLAVVGMAYVIMCIALRLLSGNRSENTYMTVILDGNNSDLELMAAAERLKWDSALKNITVFAVDCGINTETADSCRVIASRTDGMVFITADEYRKIIEDRITG